MDVYRKRGIATQKIIIFSSNLILNVCFIQNYCEEVPIREGCKKEKSVLYDDVFRVQIMGSFVFAQMLKILCF
jgi:hypothetical protein